MKFERFEVGSHVYLNSAGLGWLRVMGPGAGDQILCTSILPPDIMGMAGTNVGYKVASRTLNECTLTPCIEPQPLSAYPFGVYKILVKVGTGSPRVGDYLMYLSRGQAVSLMADNPFTVSKAEWQVALEPVAGPVMIEFQGNPARPILVQQ